MVNMQYDYFCTVGSGLEYFSSRELQSLAATNVSEISEGKVFFSSRLPAHKLLSLKTPERLFLLVHKQPQFLISHPKRISIQILRDMIEVSVRGKLENCLKKWKDFPCCSNCSNMDHLSYRVSCKVFGEIKKVFPPSFLGKIIAGSLLNIRPSWSTDLRNPQLEVLVHAKKDTLIVGMACCPMSNPLSKRAYLPSTMSYSFLRPTVCSALIDCGLSVYNRLSEREGDIINTSVLKKQHFVILDPMCGSGIILAEAAVILKNKNITLLGSDIDKFQVETASRNIQNVENYLKENKVACGIGYSNKCSTNLFVADARALPLKDSSVDVIISDLPFGLKHYSYPWRKESYHYKKLKNMHEEHECQQQIPEYNSQADGNDAPLLIRNVREEIISGTAIKLDSVMQRNAKEGDHKLGCQTKIEDVEEEVSPPQKRRKLEDMETKKAVGVDGTKNMLPNLVKELDRVLNSGGLCVLLVSENLKSDLISAVRKNTKHGRHSWVPDHVLETNKSRKNDMDQLIIQKGKGENVAVMESYEKDTNASITNEHSWVPIEQYPVKLGVLDANICVFRKQEMVS